MSRDRLIRLGVLAFIIVAVVVLARLTGLTNFISPDNLGRLREYIESFGPAAPLVFILVYAVATVAFLPGTPLTLLAGLAFGPVLGSIYVLIGATTGLTLAFLVARATPPAASSPPGLKTTSV